MTAQSSEKLAKVLEEAGLIDLARRARTDEFHDFLSNHALPDLELDSELLQAMRLDPSPQIRVAAENIRARHHQGEFDATREESDDWAASEDGQDAFSRLLRGD